MKLGLPILHKPDCQPWHCYHGEARCGLDLELDLEMEPDRTAKVHCHWLQMYKNQFRNILIWPIWHYMATCCHMLPLIFIAKLRSIWRSLPVFQAEVVRYPIVPLIYRYPKSAISPRKITPHASITKRMFFIRVWVGYVKTHFSFFKSICDRFQMPPRNSIASWP